MSKLSKLVITFSAPGVRLTSALKGEDTEANRMRLRHNLQTAKAKWERKAKRVLPAGEVSFSIE